MNPNTLKLHHLGQRLWLDHIGRDLLTGGRLARDITEFSITGLTWDAASFQRTIASGARDDALQVLDAAGLAGEALLHELALEDLTQAADLFRPAFDATRGADGWVSLDVSPLLAHDAAATLKAARILHVKASRPNLFVNIPGTPEGIVAIEQAIFEGIPVNATLLFSREHCVAASQAHVRGLERRLDAGLNPRVESVASLVVNRWDVAVKEEISSPFHDRLGITMAMRAYKAHDDLLASQRWQRLAAAGARPQRLLWAGTGTQDPACRDTFYVEALVAPNTITTVSEKTLLAFADHGKARAVLPSDGGYANAVLEEFRREGVDDDALAARLQREGVEANIVSWRALLSAVNEKTAQSAHAQAA